VANKIVVLKNGTITEIGDHQSLMEAKGDYYTLFSTQAKRYIAGNENPPPPPPSPSPFFKGRP
jgi:ABC-type transport system involved in cytochrome bd biosynthesis fused ATPase/permease subunit